MAFDYDLFVIGGGSGGVRAARVAAATGAKVALAEEYRMGGTCVIRGCVPKKLMVFASGFPELMKEARGYGWSADVGTFDWPAFRTRLHEGLDKLEETYRRLLDNSEVEIFDSRAVLNDPHTVELADGTRKTAKHILIATGGHPVRPEIANAELGMVSNDIFLMEELPKSVLIIGGGYIACEFACILNGLGVEVTQYYRGAQILRGFDDEARGLVAEQMRDKGIDLHVGANLTEMKRLGDHDPELMRATPSDAASVDLATDDARRTDVADGPIWTKATNGTEKVVDRVLFATGRDPNTRGMGLEEAGVKIGRRGEVIVDDYSQTSVPSIYAVGDVTNRVQLTPVAIREGMAFVETVFNDNPTKVDHDLIPSAIFTQPEMGTIGLSEEDAREQEPIDVYCTSFTPMRQGFVEKGERVLMKLIVSKQTDKVLGCHIVAPEAGEMIQLAGIAVKMGATKADFDRTVAVHPTMSEELVTMKVPVRSW